MNGHVPNGWDDTLLVTISAAAIILMRSLERDVPVSTSEQMFPCCGSSMWPAQDGGSDVFICCCNVGNQVGVSHVGTDVVLDLGAGSTERVRSSEWRDAVHSFADQVSSLYAHSAPKVVPDDDFDRRGHLTFLAEWESRRGIALGSPPTGRA